MKFSAASLKAIAITFVALLPCVFLLITDGILVLGQQGPYCTSDVDTCQDFVPEYFQHGPVFPRFVDFCAKEDNYPNVFAVGCVPEGEKDLPWMWATWDRNGEQVQFAYGWGQYSPNWGRLTPFQGEVDSASLFSASFWVTEVELYWYGWDTMVLSCAQDCVEHPCYSEAWWMLKQKEMVIETGPPVGYCMGLSETNTRRKRIFEYGNDTEGHCFFAAVTGDASGTHSILASAMFTNCLCTEPLKENVQESIMMHFKVEQKYYDEELGRYEIGPSILYSYAHQDARITEEAVVAGP